jgi:hypothetical protein
MSGAQCCAGVEPLELQGFSSQFLANAARPGGTITPSVNLGDEQRARLKVE